MKTVLEEDWEKTRQGEEGALAGECPGEWYVRHVQENFLYEEGQNLSRGLQLLIYIDMDKEDRLRRRQGENETGQGRQQKCHMEHK